jgi:hypothetical protein
MNIEQNREKNQSGKTKGKCLVWKNVKFKNLHVHRSTGYLFYASIQPTLLPSVTELSPSWCEGKFQLLDH